MFLAICRVSLAVTDEQQLLDSLSSILNSDFLKGANGDDAPKVIWPSKFSMTVSSNSIIYNTTVGMKFDTPKNRIWTQVNYTSPIFGDYEAFQMSLFPSNKNVSLKIDDECKWASVSDISYIYLNLIFSSWSYYTKYNGKTEEGLHEFRVIDAVQKQKVGNITFLFQEVSGQEHVQLIKMGVQSDSLPTPLMLDVIKPVTDQPDMSDEGKYSSPTSINLSLDFQFGETK